MLLAIVGVGVILPIIGYQETIVRGFANKNFAKLVVAEDCRLMVRDFPVIGVGAQFLRFVSWNFVASGLVFTCSGMFQALGNTVPALLSSASRLFLFAIPAVWLSRRPGFELRQLWLLSVTTVALQALFSYWLLQQEFHRRLTRS